MAPKKGKADKTAPEDGKSDASEVLYCTHIQWPTKVLRWYWTISVSVSLVWMV